MGCKGGTPGRGVGCKGGTPAHLGGEWGVKGTPGRGVG